MPLGLYLHFPFCLNRCSYCDFYTEAYDRSQEDRFYEALFEETRLLAVELDSSDRCLSSIYVGGGTPSLTNIEWLRRWLVQVRRYFTGSPDLEFTVELNPESATLETLTSLGELGVNRPVFGVQTFNPGLLKTLDRRHDPHASHRAIYYANALGFANSGVDLIFGLPGQSSRLLSADLDQLIDLEPPHISFYQLRIETGTELARQVSDGTLRLPDTELVAAMYRGGCEHLTEAGYVRYEVSSFARPGFECRHNLGYWTGSEYLGLGPSAHSFMKGRRFTNVSNLDEYIARVISGHLPRAVDAVGTEHHMIEAIMLGLRTSRGISRTQFSDTFGVPVESRFNREQYRLLVESGHLVPDRDNLRLSEEGILVADEITRRLIK